MLKVDDLISSKHKNTVINFPCEYQFQFPLYIFEFSTLIFYKINNSGFQFIIIIQVDPWYAPGTYTVYLNQFISNYVNPNKIQTVTYQFRFNSLTNLTFRWGNFMLIGFCPSMDIGSKITVDRLSSHPTENLAVKKKNPDIPFLLYLF